MERRLRLRRREALRLMSGAAAVAATMHPCVAVAQSAPPIRLVTLQIDGGGEAYYATDMGFFKKAGLNIDLSALPNGATIAAALVSGSIDIGLANVVALAQAHLRSVPIVVIAPADAYVSSSPKSAMVVSKTSSISTPKDVLGKIVAVSTLKSEGDIALRSWLDANGLSASSVNIIEMRYSAMDAALASGRIDVALLEEPVLSETLAQHGRLLANGYDAIGKEFCSAAWFCMADYARANPDVVRKFAAVIEQTAAWANKNHEITAKILGKYDKLTLPPNVHRSYYLERLAASDFQPIINAAAKYGALSASFPARELFAPGFGA